MVGVNASRFLPHVGKPSRNLVLPFPHVGKPCLYKKEVVRQNNLSPVPSCKIAFFVKDTRFAGELFLFYNPIMLFH
jgi:hypothetical protein